MKKDEFQGLIGRYISGKASEEENRLLEEYYTRLQGKIDLLSEKDEENVRREILYAVLEKASISQKSVIWLRRSWFKYAVAASVAVLAYFIFFNNPTKQPSYAENKIISHDIAPGGNKAILTLGNGKQIILDSAHNGVLAIQGNAKIVKTDSGRLAYNIINEKPSEVSYNVLTIPNGGQFQLVLPDGSQVWLNAASSIRYPTAFAGKERTVEITGEAYFEVTRNPKMPFHVKVDGADVQVLGTHFNINAYEEEPDMKTTLLEGSVKISKGSNSGILKPGQRAQINRFGTVNILDDADTVQAVAWKNGLFQFGRTDLTTIMRQVSRWYDVQIIYENKKEQHFSGIVSRNIPVSGVLKILESNGAKFEIEGKKIIVK